VINIQPLLKFWIPTQLFDLGPMKNEGKYF